MRALSTQRRTATKRRSSGKRSGRSGSAATLRAEPRQSSTAVAEPLVHETVQKEEAPKRRLRVNKVPSATVTSEPVKEETSRRPIARARAAAATIASPAPSQESNSRPSTGRRERTPTSPARRRTVVNTERFEGLQRFIRETMAEIRKVIWPDRETTRNLTLVVIAVSVVLGIMLGGIDYVLFQLFEALP